MPESSPPPEFETLPLDAIAQMVEDRRLPPVETWNPAHCGNSGMCIARDGIWYHEGSPITRPAMVRLFSTILRREPDGRFVLVTPAEKLDINVEDAPFVATAVQSEGTGPERRIAFRLNTGDPVLADADHPIRCEEKADGLHPYVQVRPGIDALIARSVWYELVQYALDESAAGLWSGGSFFSLEPAA